MLQRNVRVLFICSQNKLRSRTAETLFEGRLGFDVPSAGNSPDARVVLDAKLIQWADRIVCMDREHLSHVRKKFGSIVEHRVLLCWGIPDEYDYMQPELVELLEENWKRILI